MPSVAHVASAIMRLGFGGAVFAAYCLGGALADYLDAVCR